MNKFFVIVFFLYFSNALALEKKKLSDEVWEKKVTTLNWKNLDEKDQKVQIIKANAEVSIIKEELFLDNFKDINQYSWWSFGYAADNTTNMLIKGTGYTMYLDFMNDGYIKLDDWEKVNTKDLLNQMRETAKKNEAYFKSKNIDYATNVDWIFKPTLNRENKSVSYSYKVKWSSGRESMESKNLILGKNGHIESVLVTSVNEPEGFQLQSDFSKDFVNGVTFNDGYKHSDYKPGDKLATAGIGGLVAGSLGVKALAKTGMLAKLAKFWWVLLAPLAFLGKFLSGSEKSNSTTGSKNLKRSFKRRKK